MRLTGRGSRWGHRVARWYPAGWRARYGDELAAVLDARPLDRGAAVDLARGVMDAWLHPLDGDGRTTRIAAGVAGVGWTLAGAITIAEPTLPDWPGFLSTTLPIGAVAATAGLLATIGIWQRSGDQGGRLASGSLVVAIAGYVAWCVALMVATLGGPYGAVTAATGSVAAVGMMLVGLVRMRADDHPAGELLLLAGAAILVPSPVAWFAVGAAWLLLALVLWRPPSETRPDLGVRPSGAGT